MNKSSPFHFLVALALLTAFVVPVGSASVDTTAAVGNVAPEIVSIELPVTVQPMAGATKSVTATITAADGNSFQDLVAVTVTVYAPDGTTVHRSAASAVSNADGNGVTETYDHTFVMDFHDDPGAYLVTATATDSQGVTSSAFSADFTYARLAALALSGSAIDFGTLEPGARSATAALGITNKGNVVIDIDTSGTDLQDGDGHTIAVERIKYDLVNATFQNERSLSSAPSTNTGFDLAKGAASSKDSFWALDTPSGEEQYIPAGTYRGTLVVAALEG